MGGRFQKITFGGVALAAVALATATGGVHLLATADAVGTRQGDTPASIPFENHDPEVRGMLLGLFSGSATRYAAQEELVRRCMEQRGFAYVSPEGRQAGRTAGRSSPDRSTGHRCGGRPG
ncbi:hypothetical protein GCM10010517_70310 [Streptosporangium fragile]|uniref:Uncharacterized protein n=2 Tax=Streptosporangium fragile TaxID=46186 RepID=A0ABN3W8P2_9ACTN